METARYNEDRLRGIGVISPPRRHPGKTAFRSSRKRYARKSQTPQVVEGQLLSKRFRVTDRSLASLLLRAMQLGLNVHTIASAYRKRREYVTASKVEVVTTDTWARKG